MLADAAAEAVAGAVDRPVHPPAGRHRRRPRVPRGPSGRRRGPRADRPLRGLHRRRHRRPGRARADPPLRRRHGPLQRAGPPPGRRPRQLPGPAGQLHGRRRQHPEQRRRPGQLDRRLAPATLVARASGPLVGVVNAAGSNVQRSFTLQPSGTVTWNASGDELIEAQLNAFIHARIVKDFVARALRARPRVARQPAAGQRQHRRLLQRLLRRRRRSTSSSRSGQCENTGRLADVVYHEFGHSLHAHSIIDGVGAFDGALSEGLADYLAATITGDPGMGRGFFYDEGPLRHIDPPDMEHVWPRDVGEIHYTGLIFAGAMWDLRKLLIQQYGESRRRRPGRPPLLRRRSSARSTSRPPTSRSSSRTTTTAT